jgi:hypothetical protein
LLAHWPPLEQLRAEHSGSDSGPTGRSAEANAAEADPRLYERCTSMSSTMNRPRLPDVSTRDAAAGPGLTADRVWHEIEKASFAVLSHVTPAGKPRSSGVVYAAVGRRLYVAVDPTGWKARQIADGAEVAVTVPIRRGGLLSLVFPIPPATISFHARVTVHPGGSVSIESLPKQLARLLPPDRRSACLLEMVPEGTFLTYGVGVSLQDMTKPAAARAHVLAA